MGTHFAGSQIQPGQRTVQGDLESALSLILRQPVQVQGSSRTDAGVHAKHQIFQGEWESDILESDLVFKLNRFLKADLAIHRIWAVPSNFHARFDAQYRQYQYFISFQKNPFQQQTSWQYSGKLNLNLMQEAAQFLLGEHDFQAFSKVKTDVATFWCRIDLATWDISETHATFTIQANRFLRGMVRAIVGTLVEVGLGKISLPQFQAILENKDRKLAGPSAPALGLRLTQVGYPEFPPVVRSARPTEMIQVRTFFEQYAEELGIDLGFQGFQEELTQLPYLYQASLRGDILWLEQAGELVGIVALKALSDEIAEMKRLFILPQRRGAGWSHVLVEGVENRARQFGYKSLKLDTLARLSSAVQLYEQRGYIRTEPYNVNPEPDILYYQKIL